MMRAEFIGRFTPPRMTDIYIHINARVADYIRTHPYVPLSESVRFVRVRLHIIGNVRINIVGKYRSCVVSKLPIIYICKQTVVVMTALVPSDLFWLCVRVFAPCTYL